jgi:toxin ParE1/3/4
MTFQVLLTDDACADLAALYDYIACHDAPAQANYVLDQIEAAFSGLSANPQRSVYPKELRAAGLREYREIYFKEPLKNVMSEAETRQKLAKYRSL